MSCIRYGSRFHMVSCFPCESFVKEATETKELIVFIEFSPKLIWIQVRHSFKRNGSGKCLAGLIFVLNLGISLGSDDFSKPALGTVDRSLLHFTLGLGLPPSGGHCQLPGSVTAGVSIPGDGESSIMPLSPCACQCAIWYLAFDLLQLTVSKLDALVQNAFVPTLAPQAVKASRITRTARTSTYH